MAIFTEVEESAACQGKAASGAEAEKAATGAKAEVQDQAEIQGQAMSGAKAEVQDQAEIQGQAMSGAKADVQDQAEIQGQATTGVQAEIHGKTATGSKVEIHRKMATGDKVEIHGKTATGAKVVIHGKMTTESHGDAKAQESFASVDDRGGDLGLKSTGHAISGYTDDDITKMKNRILELELLNDDLNRQLEDANSQLKECAPTLECEFDAELKSVHDVFICHSESGFQKLEEMLSAPTSKVINYVSVHGILKKKEFKEVPKHRYGLYVPPHERKGQIFTPQEFKRMTPLGKMVFLGVIEDLYRLHRKGFSLDGQFNLQDFFWTNEKKVKLDPSLKSLVVSKKHRESAVTNDYHRIYKVIVEILGLQEESASSDLQYLLELLSSEDPVFYEDIIRYNISLMTEIGKKSHFITLFDRWIQIEKEDIKMKEAAKKEAEQLKAKANNVKSEAGKSILTDDSEAVSLIEKCASDIVLEFIPTLAEGSNGITEEWSNLVRNNVHVTTVYDIRATRIGQPRLTGPKELLIVWRNALTHIIDESFDGDKTVFFDEDIVNMLEYAVPGVFNQLQKGMHEVGHGELPHLMRTMRM